MEILQTIWSVLTTESEATTRIITLPFMFIETYLYMLNFTTILNISYTNFQKKLYVVLFSILCMLSISFIPSPYYTFVNIIIWPILVFFIFKTSILKSILSEIVIYIASILINSIFIGIAVYIFKLSSVLIETVPLYRIIFCILTYLSYYLLYRLCAKRTISIHFLDKIKNQTNKRLIYNFILGTIAIALQCYIEFMYIDYIPFYLIILSVSVLIVYFILSLYSLYRTSQLEITIAKLEEEKLYNKTLTVLYDKIRGFKHDFNNIVQGIGGYIATNNMDGLKEYYSQVLDDCQKVNNLALLSPEVINNPAIYSLLTAKYHDAAELGIKFNLEIFMDLSTINMKIYELTRILGILIDNAIDAAKQCEEKEITITFRKDNKKNKQLFIIENTYMNKDVNIDEIFEKGKTSKKSKDVKSHGLGLWEVRQTVKRNKNLDLYTTKSEKYFKQQFEIYC